MRKYYLSLIESYRPLCEASDSELIFRMNCLHAESMNSTEDAGIFISDLREAVVISKELKRRLEKFKTFMRRKK